MAKSTRSKTMRAFRRTKRERETSAYAVTHAARLERLSKKLAEIAQPTKNVEPHIEDDADNASEADAVLEGPKSSGETGTEMDVDPPKKISTSGRRPNRRQEWRAARGLPEQKRSGNLNRQGNLKAVRRSGRSKRRR